MFSCLDCMPDYLNNFFSYPQVSTSRDIWFCGCLVTIPQIRSVRPWYGHWRPSLKYKKKTGLTDRGMATGVKKPRSVRPWYDLWHPGAKCVRKKTLVWQTVVWPLGLKNPGLTDWGVATGVTKFRMDSGGLTVKVFTPPPHGLPSTPLE